MGFGNSGLVHQNSILWLVNQMVSVALVKMLTAHSWLGGMAESTAFLMGKPRNIHFQVSRVDSESKEFSVIGMVACGSELQIRVLFTHTTEKRICFGVPKDSQATTFILSLKIGKRTFGWERLMGWIAFAIFRSSRLEGMRV